MLDHLRCYGPASRKSLGQIDKPVRRIGVRTHFLVLDDPLPHFLELLRTIAVGLMPIRVPIMAIRKYYGIHRMDGI